MIITWWERTLLAFVRGTESIDGNTVTTVKFMFSKMYVMKVQIFRGKRIS